MTTIVWIQPDENTGLKVSRGQVNEYWQGPAGLAGLLKACPKPGSDDLLILCEDVLSLPVHLPIQPGKEPKDRDALRESLKWEAEPFLGYAPLDAPFDFAPAGEGEASMGGSDWWIASVEENAFSAWEQACKPTRQKLRCAMDPWSAIASCLPDGNHLLIHRKRVLLVQLSDQCMQVFKTWRRPPGSSHESMEWIPEILSAPEWIRIKENVRIWDLCGSLDLLAITEILANQTAVPVQPSGQETSDHEPWCDLLASGADRLVKGRPPLPAARPVKEAGSPVGALETLLYFIMGVALTAGLIYWYQLDSTALNTLKENAASIGSRKGPNTKQNTISDLTEKKLSMAEQLAELEWLEKESPWRRELPGALITFFRNMSFDNTWLTCAEGRPTEEGYHVDLLGKSSDQNEVRIMREQLKSTDLAGARAKVKEDPLTFEDQTGFGDFSISLFWPQKNAKAD